jgi:hypothetical protein
MTKLTALMDIWYLYLSAVVKHEVAENVCCLSHGLSACKSGFTPVAYRFVGKSPKEERNISLRSLK